MKFNNIRHIFFDLDHTLWDFDKNSGLAFSSIFSKHELSIEVDRFLEVYMPINADYWKRYRENKVTKEDLRHGRLLDAFKVLNLTVTNDVVAQLSVDYIDHLPNNNHLLQGTAEILEYLYEIYDLHIITNGFKEVQHKKLERSGILKFFKTVTTSEDVGVQKPNRKIFEVALQNASAKVDESVMIGDNFEADILGAQNLGMRTIIYNYYNEKFSPDYYQVVEMKELTRYL